jgi:hypothetical protein
MPLAWNIELPASRDNPVSEDIICAPDTQMISGDATDFG